MIKLAVRLSQLRKSPLVVNSSWALTSQILQSILLSLFFVLVARNYSTIIFSNFILATVLYQLIAAFSSLGLSQWFIRELEGAPDQKEKVSKFISLQLFSGIGFYFINIAVCCLLYDDKMIQMLAAFMGINIIFDNIINAIKCINISNYNQRKTFIILSTEAFLKFSATCLLFVFPLSIISLTLLLLVIRLASLNMFLRTGTSQLINLRSILRVKISIKYVLELLSINWPFLVLGSISIINWRISTIIISKTLPIEDVATFEISYKIFSIAQMLPIVVASSVFPILIKTFRENKLKDFRYLYSQIHLLYFLYGLFCFTSVYSFIDSLLPVIFGSNYKVAGLATKQMFLTILLFPTAFLQANVLVAMKLERVDMWFNIFSLLTNLAFCIFGVYYFDSLGAVIISIFLSYIVFHILQNIALIKRGIIGRQHATRFYALTILSVGSYLLLAEYANGVGLFAIFWMTILCLYLYRYKIKLAKAKFFSLKQS